MKYQLNVLISLLILFGSGFIITACSKHQNPLLNPVSIQKLKAYYSFSLDNETEICPEYYAGITSSQITATTKTVCDAQLQSDYAFLSKNRQDLLNGASIHDLRDPMLWKMYLESKG